VRWDGIMGIMGNRMNVWIEVEIIINYNNNNNNDDGPMSRYF